MNRLKNSVTERQFILLSGIPGSGKTKLGKYLKEKHGFYFFETDSHWTEFINALCELGAEKFIDKLLIEHGCVCLEWGFDPQIPQFLSCVLRFKNQGASIFWFTCDKDIARSNYLEAHPDDPKGERWKNQVKKIENARLPTSDFVIIETYHNGKPIPFEELTPKILSKRGYLGD